LVHFERGLALSSIPNPSKAHLGDAREAFLAAAVALEEGLSVRTEPGIFGAETDFVLNANTASLSLTARFYRPWSLLRMAALPSAEEQAVRTNRQMDDTLQFRRRLAELLWERLTALRRAASTLAALQISVPGTWEALALRCGEGCGAFLEAEILAELKSMHLAETVTEHTADRQEARTQELCRSLNASFKNSRDALDEVFHAQLTGMTNPARAAFAGLRNQAGALLIRLFERLETEWAEEKDRGDVRKAGGDVRALLQSRRPLPPFVE
jgi:hypothetical protein